MLLSPKHSGLLLHRPRRALVLLLALGSVAPSVVHAQLAAGFAPICGDGQRPVTKTTEVIVALKPAEGFGDATRYSRAQLVRIQYYIDAIRQRFVAPSSLGALPTFAESSITTPPGSVTAPGSALHGRLLLVVKNDGRLRSQLWEYAPISNVWTVTLKRAIAAADSAGDFEGFVRPDEPDVSDTLAIDVHTTFTTAAPQFPFMRVNIETYLTSTPAMVVKQSKAYYPAVAKQAGAEANALAMFVIGSDGAAIESLVQILKVRWRDFVIPIQRMVATSEYAPARSGGCAVPALVQQEFVFALNRP
jgi:hypothetical protein